MKTLWFTRCLLLTSFSDCYRLEGSSQSTNTHGFKNSSSPVQFCHSRRQPNRVFWGFQNGNLSVSGAISQPRGVKHGGSFNHRISRSWNEVGLQKTFGVCTCTFGGGWGWRKVGRNFWYQVFFWRILKVYIYIYMYISNRHICIFIYIYRYIPLLHSFFFQTSMDFWSKKVSALPKTYPVQLDQGHQRKSPRVNILRGIWTLMNGRRVFPCKFEVIEKNPPSASLHDSLVVTIAYEIAFQVVQVACHHLFLLSLCSTLADRRRKNTGAGWLWDTSSGHDPVYASPIHCLTSIWWRIVLQRPGRSQRKVYINFRSCWWWNHWLLSEKFFRCFQDVFFFAGILGCFFIHLHYMI